MDWEVSLQLSSPGPTSAVPPGWYLVPEMSHALYGNVPVNGLDEWDISKLGWFKSRRNRDHIDGGRHRIRDAFSATVTDCRSNQYHGEV